ncbi:sensor domain-containing diguanylate cyclase [Vibrio fluvialis]|uniref:sensor domain-containing diguanylate cyclase n=1 Tax=Vibrio fluvialis TaxID=676 RepID=UPI0012AE2D4D|nr:sensor domain-containing diguanylate cyclase [Vibrio fluvialis]
MQIPAKPLDEQQRIANLHKLGILDTAPEERFDRVTRLARRLFDVPIALVTLVDEKRQWFKSSFGLDVKETPRDVSFCGHAILGDEPFIINDAEVDERFADNPLVTDKPHIRFYAGVPLVFQDGTKLGTLCIIDTEPRNLDQDQIVDLLDLAKMAERELSATHNASMDELTNISNRRGFLSLVGKSLVHCRFNSMPYSLAFFDLNGFKEINDKLGHSIGDDALQDFAQLMKQSFRESDLLARLGGDEFVVFMSATLPADAENAIERFRQSVAQFNHTAGRPYQLAFCSGTVAGDGVADVSIDTLLEQADQVMYRQKTQIRAAKGR